MVNQLPRVRVALLIALLLLVIQSVTQLRADSAPTVTSTTAPTLIIINGNFEDAKLTGFSTPPGSQCELDSVDPGQGKQSLRIDAFPKVPTNVVSTDLAEAVVVQPKTVYRLSVLCRNGLTNSKAEFGIREIKRDRTPIRYVWSIVPVGNNCWQRYEMTLAPSEEAHRLQVCLLVPPQAEGGSVWWDDVLLSAMPYPVDELQPPLLTLAPLEQSVVEHSPGGDNPAVLSLWVDAQFGLVGGKIKTALTTAGEAAPLWQNTVTVGHIGPQELQVPTASLAPGRYSLDLEATSADGLSRFQIEKPVAVLTTPPPQSPDPIHESSITAPGVLRVNGQPFSSIYLYHTPLTTDTLTQLHNVYGATTAQVFSKIDTVDLVRAVNTAYRAGLYSWVCLFQSPTFDDALKSWKTQALLDVVNRIKDNPGLIGWDLSDEPDGHNTSFKEVKRAYDLIRGADPHHVIWTNLCYPSQFGSYAGCSDLASYDHYPLPQEPLTELHRYNTLIRAADGPAQPLISTIQTFSYPDQPLPTPAQLRALVYMDVCDGMSNFQYYTWSDPLPFHSLQSSPELRDAVRVINHEMRQLHDFLFSTNVVNTPLEALDKAGLFHRLAGAAGHFQLVVVNPWPRSVEVRQAIPGLWIRTALGIFDRVPLNVEQGVIVQTIAPYGVWIEGITTDSSSSAEPKVGHLLAAPATLPAQN